MRQTAPSEEGFDERLRRRLEELSCSDPSGGLLVAFSGGADSTALAAACAPLAAGGRKVVLGMVDHGMRDRSELDAERAAAQRTADSLALPLRVASLGQGRVARLADELSCGPEAAARKLRYEALERLRREEGLTWIATGHNAQDQAETLIVRFFQGSGPRGLRGMPPRRGRILRPMLGLCREEIEAWLRSRGIPWSRDSSNDEALFQRNAVRLRLLPLLDSLFPGWRASVEKGRRRMELLASYLEGEASSVAWKETDGALSVEGKAWRDLHPALRLQLLEDAAARLKPGSRMPFSLLERAIGPEGAPPLPIRVEGAGLDIRVDDAGCSVKERLVLPAKKGYFFRVDGAMTGRFPDGRGFSLSEGHDPAKGPALDSFSYPAVLRNARAGDRMAAGKGSRLLSELFEGRSGAGLEALPVLEDAYGIVCAFGSALGAANRYAERGRAPAKGSPCLEFSVEGSVSPDVQQRT